MSIMSKRNLVSVAILIVMTIVCSSVSALAADAISVEKIAPIYVERGSQNCLVTIKAHVTNNGESDNVTIEVVGVDAEGFQLQTVKLNGSIDSGATKVLLERFKMPASSYDQIVEWELKE